MVASSINYKELVSKKHYEEFIQNFWLNLGNTATIHTPNIFGTSKIFRDNPALGLIDILRRPENFSYTCKLIFNKTIHPLQANILRIMWNHPFPMLIGSRGIGKTFMISMYVLLLALFKPGSRIVLTGTAFRQAKFIFNYCEEIWKNAPIFRDILSFDKNNRPIHDVDMHQFRIFESTISAIPTGTGEKIRGLRSSCLICDEFNSIDINIFEEIMQGFSSVSMSPISNVQEYARLQALKVLGEITTEQFEAEEANIAVNQNIISGTCGFTFEHLYKYWKKYHDIIMSRGEKKKIEQIFNGEPPPGFNWRDYAIIRIPYDLLPPKFMDEKSIGKAKATTNSGIFGAEFQAIFMSDTSGFYKRTLIEKATCRNTTPPLSKPSCGIVEFNALMRGDRSRQYIFAIDPAAQEDNFAISILELWPDHRRIVHVWTINDKIHKEKLRRGLVKEHDYYRYCGRKIRELMKVFPCYAIAMDAQGGGKAVKEVLGDPAYCEPGEQPIYEIIETDVNKDTDNLDGLHILHMIEFADAKWVYDANHGLRFDLETQELVFPLKDSLAFGMAREDDKLHKRIRIDEEDPDMENYGDTLENCMLEIEELKNELVLIEHSKTPSGRDRWDTPQVKGIGSKKGRLKKDRYSALLMANMVGRTLIARLAEQQEFSGHAAHELNQKKRNKHDGEEYGLFISRGNMKTNKNIGGLYDIFT